MIRSVQATEVVQDEDGAVVAKGPLFDFEITMSNRDFDKLKTARIITHLEVTSNGPVLVGFCDEERRRLYLALRKINGIGVRTAVKILDCGGVFDTLLAVASKDSSYFDEVPGIGPKRIAEVIAKLNRTYQEALPESIPASVRLWVEYWDAYIQVNDVDSHEEVELINILRNCQDKAEADTHLRNLIESLA